MDHKTGSRRHGRILALKDFLDEKADRFNQPGFIVNDPISIPHRFTLKQDIEIAGLFAATLAWGQRKTIIANCHRLLAWMDNSPHQFITSHTTSDLRAFKEFKHRTFNATDLIYFVEFLKWFYSNHSSLEQAFITDEKSDDTELALINFQRLFFSLPDFPKRTVKHVSTPVRKSACKRINMFLRWMVRDDQRGVDFGIWKRLRPAQLICPCDVHVDRVARKLKLIGKRPLNWATAVELTKALRVLDPVDPVKYDFALFGLGVEEGFAD
jgi:uncharacterized protein (TIGR02757 family)